MKHFLTKRTGFLMLFLGFLLCSVYSQAQYTLTSIETGRFYTAVTRDGSNNIYATRYDAPSNSYQVVKYTNGTGTPSVLASGFQFGTIEFPWGLAVNVNGDVFVTDIDAGQNWRIIKLTAPTYAATVIHTGGFYSALAIDNNNHLLSVEYNSGTNSYRLVRYPFGAEAGAGTVVWNGLPQLALPTGNTTYPWGLVCDASGNIYLTGFHETAGSQMIKLTAPTYTPTVLNSNKSYTALTIDGSNNFYTIEGVDAATAKIMKYTDLSAAGTQIYTGLTNASFFYPWGLAVNGAGEVFAGDGGASGGGRLIKLAPPSVTVSSVNRVTAATTNANSVQYTVTFSGSVTGVTTSSFALNTTGISGASISSVSGSGTTYTVTVNTGTGDGTVRLDVNGSGISPTVSNAPFTTGQVYTIDKTAPTGSIVINSGAAYTNNTSVTLTLTGSDASTPLQMAFSIDGGAFTADETFATTKNLTLPATDGTRTVTVRLKDAAGNTVTYSDDIILDRLAPNTTITSNPANPTTSNSATFTFTSSESGSTFEGSLDGGSYTAVISPLTLTGLADGSHTFSVRAKDQAGNTDATPATYTWTIDVTQPTVTSVDVPVNGYYKAGDQLDFSVHFSENVTVTGTPQLSITIGSTTVQANYTGGTGTNILTFSYTVVTGNNDADGITVGSALQLNGGTITDGINNATLTLNGLPSTTGVFVNTTTPTVVLSTTAPALVNAPFTVTVTFSENVTGLAASDFAVTNATISNVASVNSSTFTALITPTADGTVTVNLPAGTVVNIGNNGNSASNTVTHTYDGTAPAVTMVAVPANGLYIEGDVLDFDVHFTENVAVNTAGGNPTLSIQIGSQTVNAVLTGSTSSTLTFSYTIAAGNMDMDGITIGALQLNGSTIRDAATNNANLTLNNVGNTTAVRVNTAHPSVVITGTPAVTGSWTATITFSEAVTGFTVTDFSVTNATITNLATSDNITYTVTVTPIAGGPVSITVPANAAANIAGNGNAVSNTLSYTYDQIPPVVTSVTVPANGYYKAGNTLSFTVNFDENVVVTGTPALPITIGSTTVYATYTGGTGTSALTFAYTVVTGNNDMDGIAIGNALQLNGGTIKDLAANNGNLTLNSIGNTSGVFVNTVTPTVVIGGTIVLNAPSTVNIVFSEAVTGFAISDIQLTNATASNLQTTDNITYTALITPAAEGNVSIQVPANAAVNIGGNGNSASSTLSYYYDPNPPVITSVAVPANGYYKAGDVLNFTVNFSENVQVLGAATPSLAVIIGSATVQAAYTGGTNTNALSFSYTVQDGDLDMDGIALGASLQLNGAVIRDLSFNNADLTLQNAGNTTQVFVNTTHATVVLSTTAASRVNAAFTVTVTFSEAVTGLALADFTVTNATVSNLQTSDNITYTITVTPSADGSVSVSLPADAALNVANNGTKASNTITVTRDATAPVITAAQSFSILQNSAIGTQIGQVAASDASGITQNFAISSDPTGGAFQISATGIISVKDMAILNNNVGSTINVLVTVTDGLNTSAATPVAIKINAINKAPVLDAINNVVLCATTNSQTIQLTGASAVEPTQTYTLSIASNQALFDVLTVNAAGLITYQLKPGTTSGVATITVTIKDNGGTANGGVDTYQRTFTITVNPLPVVTITSDKGNSVSKGDVVILTATGGATYAWTATTNSINSGAQTAVAEVRPQANTIYTVTATSNLGCKNSTTFSISTIEDFKVDATNVLTPNGDGKNDKWVIRNIDSYPDNELKIFDRSGRMVFSQRNYNNTWDGKVNGHPLAEGTYYYFLSISGGAKTAKGFITIITKAN